MNKNKRLISRFNPKLVFSFVLVLSLMVVGGQYLTEEKTTEIIEDVPGWSWVLGGTTILIDAGHGGVDPGAVGLNNTLEKDINLEIAKRLNLLFSQAGSKVVMIREDDRDFGTSAKLLQRKREDLAARIQMAIESRTDIFLSIHANSFPDQRQYGPQVFYHPSSEQGKKIAESIQESLNTISTKKRVAKSNQSLFILKSTDMVAVTIEVGFISNAEEEKKLNNPEYQQKIAMAIFAGVGNYLSQEEIVSND